MKNRSGVNDAATSVTGTLMMIISVSINPTINPSLISQSVSQSVGQLVRILMDVVKCSKVK